LRWAGTELGKTFCARLVVVDVVVDVEVDGAGSMAGGGAARGTYAENSASACSNDISSSSSVGSAPLGPCGASYKQKYIISDMTGFLMGGLDTLNRCADCACACAAIAAALVDVAALPAGKSVMCLSGGM
jgi:L-alanine-DL-glutamate epimerase-like enolase superfamily enzyme